jgi:NAD(P)H-hydrate epimerase
MTVTLGAPKLALVMPPGEVLAGTLVIADIGVPASVIASVEGPVVELLTKEAMRTLVEPRAQDSHKGDYGHVLVVAGSPGKTGAAVLAASAALRSGAGRVTVAAPAGCVGTIAGLGAEFMTLALPEDASGLVQASAVDDVLALGADVIAAGPGLGRSPGVRAFVHALVEQCGVPLVLDADAVVAFAGEPDGLLARDGAELIITPHPGEMAALTGIPVDDLQANRLSVARDFASTHRIHVILKGHRTVVATPDGRAFINLTGNAGMATAGAGDVLTGAVAAWAGQTLDVEAACKLAVYLHGLAGDLAEADEGEVGMIAGDIVARLGDAVLELTARRKKAPANGQ